MLSNKETKIDEIDKEFKIHKFRGVTPKLLDLIKSFKGTDVLVYFDPDVDGMLSGVFVCRLLASLGISYEYYVNSNRSHGWFLPVEKVKGKNIIAVDFIITREKIVELVDNGCNVISMDHHINETEFIEYSSGGKYGVVINNQYPFEEEDGRYLSGAGVVFEVFSSIYPEYNTLENRALVGITLLSDVRDIENPYARYYLYDLYNHKCRGYIGYLIDHTVGDKDYGFGVPRMDRNFVDYKFSPAINSCLRFNKEQEVVRFFLGSGYLNLEYREKQKEIVAEIQKHLDIWDFSNIRVCLFKNWQLESYKEYKSILSNFVGLVASKNLDGEHSCICYMLSFRKDEKDKWDVYVKRGSFRGRVNGLDYLEPIKDVLPGVGHPSAFGIKSFNPSNKLFRYINQMCKDVDENVKLNKDQIYKAGNLNMFSTLKGMNLAVHNAYCLSQNKKYIQYTGNNIKRKRSGAKFIEYSVDGVSVICFDKDVNFENGLICPTLDRSLVYMYLGKNDVVT